MTTEGKIAFIREHKSEKDVMKMLCDELPKFEKAVGSYIKERDEYGEARERISFFRELAKFETLVLVLNFKPFDLTLIESFMEVELNLLHDMATEEAGKAHETD